MQAHRSPHSRHRRRTHRCRVNARQMIAHIDLPDGFDTGDRFLRSLNSLCGRNIAIRSIRPVAADAHARFDATERTYRYFAHTAKNPF